MTEILDETEREIERAERPVFVREFNAELTAGDGRTVDMRIVPFGERATITDGFGGVPKGVPYEEEWMPGVFEHQVRAANRVYLNFEHQAGIAGVIGHGVSLRQASDGYHGTFRALPGADADKALALIHEGVLTGASVEAYPMKNGSVRSASGVVQRVKARLSAVALCRQGAFSGALVTAVRTPEEIVIDETLLPVDVSPELVERCRRLGIELPPRMAEVLMRTFTDVAWDGSASRWGTADAYCAASAIDRNPSGEPKSKDLCHLPYKEPGSGDINVNAVRAALSRIGQGDPQDATQQERDDAKAMLERLLTQFNKQGD